jgi:hypothetical protein
LVNGGRALAVVGAWLFFGQFVGWPGGGAKHLQ